MHVHLPYTLFYRLNESCMSCAWPYIVLSIPPAKQFTYVRTWADIHIKHTVVEAASDSVIRYMVRKSSSNFKSENYNQSSVGRSHYPMDDIDMNCIQING